MTYVLCAVACLLIAAWCLARYVAAQRAREDSLALALREASELESARQRRLERERTRRSDYYSSVIETSTDDGSLYVVQQPVVRSYTTDIAVSGDSTTVDCDTSSSFDRSSFSSFD